MRSKFTHAVLIVFQYGIDSIDPLHELADRLTYLLDQTDIGYYDGHELAMDDSDGSLYLYGHNAEQLYKLIEPTLFEVDWMEGAMVTLYFGDSTTRNTKTIDFVLEKTETST